MTRVVFAAALACALLSSRAAGQESVFGGLGFGAPEEGLSVRSRGMGNATTALPKIHFTFRNPASLAVFDRTGIFVETLLQARTAEDDANEATLTEAELPFLQLVFPVTSRIAIGGGYFRILDFGGLVDTETVFAGDTLPVQLSTEGGLAIVTPQIAWQPTARIRVGAGVDFYTGSRTRRLRVEFDPDVAVSTRDSVETGFGATGFTVGAHLVPIAPLLLGVAYRSGVTLEAERDVPATDDPEETEVLVDLPAQVSGGASVRLGPELTVAAEVETANWSDFAVDGVTPAGYDDTFGAGLGVEMAFRESLLFLPEGTALRLGARTRTLPLRFGGERVRESALSFGLGQVVGIGASVLDLAVEGGKRGDLDANGLTERFVRLSLSLSAFEQWLSRGPRRPDE